MNEKIIAAITRERNYQDAKWGPPQHTVGEWLLIVQAELDEAKLAWVKGQGDTGALEELLQVVSVGVACMEQHGIIQRFLFLKDQPWPIDKTETADHE